MFRAELRRRRGRWRVKVAAQGPAQAETETLGDAKRVAEALAQRWLVWRRISKGLWVGEPPTDEEFDRVARTHMEAVEESDN